jgi:hypothetical protein
VKNCLSTRINNDYVIKNLESSEIGVSRINSKVLNGEEEEGEAESL